MERQARPASHDAFCPLPVAEELAAHVRRGNAAAVLDMLTQRGLSPDARASPLDRTPLQIAIRSDQPAIAYLLLAQGASCNAAAEEEPGPLLLAASKGDPELVAKLLRSGADCHAIVDNESAVLNAVRSGCSKSLALLLAAGAPCDMPCHTPRGYLTTPLILAAETSNVNAAWQLVDAGADSSVLSAKGTTALDEAVDSHCEEIVWRLVAANAPSETVRQRGHQTLDRLCRSFAPDLAHLRALLATGIDCNRADIFGTTPLLSAVREGSLGVVEALLEHGANCNVRERDGTGHSALSLAALLGRDRVVCMLIAARADLHTRTLAGQTPLHIATEKGHRRVMDLLLAAGADEQARDHLNRTPEDLALAPSDAQLLRRVQWLRTVLRLVVAGRRRSVRARIGQLPPEIWELITIEYVLGP